MNYDLEKSLIDSLIGLPCRTSHTSCEIIAYGDHQSFFGQVIIWTAHPLHGKWILADKRHEKSVRIDKGGAIICGSFDKLIDELRSDDFRNANGLPPLKDSK